MTISTHVLDTSAGRPAAGVQVSLSADDGRGWREIARASTNADGRVAQLVDNGSQVGAGTYRIAFSIGDYFHKRNIESFYTTVTVEFVVRDASAHHHVPLLVSPYGYSTYRGS